MIELRAGELREFMGAGALLFPERQVSSGIAVRIHIWESDSKARSFGKTIGDVADAVSSSKLGMALKLISLAGPTTATLTLITDGAVELAKAVGAILKANSDDFVDFFEGYYPVTEAWKPGAETHNGSSSEIVVRRL